MKESESPALKKEEIKTYSFQAPGGGHLRENMISEKVKDKSISGHAKH